MTYLPSYLDLSPYPMGIPSWTRGTSCTKSGNMSSDRDIWPPDDQDDEVMHFLTSLVPGQIHQNEVRISPVEEPTPAVLQLMRVPQRRKRTWVSKALSNAWEQPVLSFSGTPEWMRDNSLIRGCYRPQQNVRQAIRSLFYWHNETVNVWSHLIGQ